MEKSAMSKKTIRIVICVLIAVIALAGLAMLLYYTFLKPIISLETGIEYSEQLELYTSNAYLNYEGGDVLKNYITSTEALKQAEPIYFYYGKNRKHDNPIHGNISDIFAVDFKVDAESYSAFYNSIAKDQYNIYKFSEADRYEIYYPVNIEHPEHLTFFALNESEKKIRVIVLPDADYYDSYGQINGYLIRWTELSFK